MKTSFVFLLLLVISLVLTPHISVAANPPSIFNGINIWVGATCGGDVITASEGPKGPCGFCDAIKIASNIMRYMFELVFYILFPIFFAWGGIQFMLSAGNPSKVKESRQILISTVIGFVIAAAAWLIMGLFFHLLSSVTNNSDLTTNNITAASNPWSKNNPWNKIECGTN